LIRFDVRPLCGPGFVSPAVIGACRIFLDQLLMIFVLGLLARVELGPGGEFLPVTEEK
jgi:hypothetical protein